jgi:hypothetical protein
LLPKEEATFLAQSRKRKGKEQATTPHSSPKATTAKVGFFKRTVWATPQKATTRS